MDEAIVDERLHLLPASCQIHTYLIAQSADVLVQLFQSLCFWAVRRQALFSLQDLLLPLQVLGPNVGLQPFFGVARARLLRHHSLAVTAYGCKIVVDRLSSLSSGLYLLVDSIQSDTRDRLLVLLEALLTGDRWVVLKLIFVRVVEVKSPLVPALNIVGIIADVTLHQEHGILTTLFVEFGPLCLYILLIV